MSSFLHPRAVFLRHQAQTSPAPIGLHIVRAEGSYLYDADGEAYIDLIGGISVCNTGHRHPAVVAAIKKQADAFLHVMVYGETVQTPQVRYAQRLAAHLPPSLDCVYFTNSGSEAVEGAIKLARRVTGRTGIVSAEKSYHGHTTGALAIMGDEYWRQAFRPLMPGVDRRPYNSEELLNAITKDTACVVLETIQAEAGVLPPDPAWLQAIRHRCTETGALLVLDEIQCGFGRTGTLWGFTQSGIVPDILLLGKALGGGMPMGAFISSREMMHTLTEHPVLGHLSTFGGHPVCCAAGDAALEVLLSEGLAEAAEEKGALLESLLRFPAIQRISRRGLLMAVGLQDAETAARAVQACLAQGLFTDWFLFAPHCLRIAPPLTISEKEIRLAAEKLGAALASAC